MPRKNARPAARKEAAQKKAKMAAKGAPKRRVGMIAHHRPSGANFATLALMASQLYRSR